MHIMNITRMILSTSAFATLSVLALLLIPRVLAYSPHCGEQAGGAPCRPGYCCSIWGWCGTTGDYCDEGKCQSQCPSPPSPFPFPFPPPPPPSTSPPPPPSPPPPTPLPDITETVSRETYQNMFEFLVEFDAPSKDFYTYEAFVNAARNFPGFGTTGNITERRREVAAFLGQTGYESANHGKLGHVISFYYIREPFNSGDVIPSYCVPNAEWPCAPGKNYYGRGPLQIRYNYNYGPCGAAIGEDLLGNPDLVETDAVISFKSAIWFWMTAQPTKPSSHDVILGKWKPTPSDIANGRSPAGYGIITNIFNGNKECGLGYISYGAYIRAYYYSYVYCFWLSVSPGENLTCDHQKPFSLQQSRPVVQDPSPLLLQ